MTTLEKYFFGRRSKKVGSKRAYMNSGEISDLIRKAVGDAAENHSAEGSECHQPLGAKGSRVADRLVVNYEDPLSPMKDAGDAEEKTPTIYIPQHRYGDFEVLTPDLRKISKMFTVLSSICRFNKHRGLKTIFHQSKKSIEDILGRRVEVSDFERMKFLLKDDIMFNKVAICQVGRRLETFSVEIGDIGQKEFDKRICDHIRSAYTKEFGLSENDTWKMIRMVNQHAGMLEVPRADIFSGEVFATDKSEARSKYEAKQATKAAINGNKSTEKGELKAMGILERIKERERMRKQEYLAECELQEGRIRELRSRIVSVYSARNIKSCEVARLVKLASLAGGIDDLTTLCREFPSVFKIKKYEGENYFVLIE